MNVIKTNKSRDYCQSKTITNVLPPTGKSYLFLTTTGTKPVVPSFTVSALTMMPSSLPKYVSLVAFISTERICGI